jgi:hypothetical protein
MRKITHILVHHTASPGAQTTLKAVDNYHKTKNWGDKKNPAYAKISSLGYFCQYHYFIDWAGKVTQCHDDNDKPWHGNDANPFSIGVCMAGWFDDGHDSTPTLAQVASLQALLVRLSQKYQIPQQNIVPHRRYNPHKSCYGANLSDTWAGSLIVLPAAPLGLTAPRIEKCGKAYAAYDPESDSMLEITDGGILKALFGGYKDTPAVEVKEWSRPLSKTKKLGFI